jgi:hypothetical protein
MPGSGPHRAGSGLNFEVSVPRPAINPAPVTCPGCRNPLPGSHCNTAELVRCPSCQVRLHIEVFPALFKTIAEGRPAEAILVAGESACFYHETKRAVLPCDVCGRFLCALCDVELDNRHLCPACLKSGYQKGRLNQLEKSRVLYDSAALWLAVLPMLLPPLTVLTAPMAIFLAILSWFRPSSIVPRTRLRSYLAIAFALAQIAFWIFAFSGAFGMFE